MQGGADSRTQIKRLGYLGIAASDLAGWARFAVDVLGVMPAEPVSSALRFRIDERAWRIEVAKGSQDDIAYLGFEVADAAGLQAMSERLSAANVAVTAAGPELLAARGVLGLLSCADPEGLAIELYWGARERREAPFCSPSGVSGFVTGDQGLGHVVLANRDIAAARWFYHDLLGFRLSDIIRLAPRPELSVDLEFYHCNRRHHTLALLPTPGRKRLNHFMLQARELDDVGLALDRAAQVGAVTQALGKHTNDQMVSFYARTPGGFDIEYGWGAQEVAQDDWQVVLHDRISIWGHAAVRSS